MKRRVRLVALMIALAATLTSSLPLEARCWGSLYVVSSSTRLRNRCPTPTLTKTWRVRCYDGCGYSSGTFSEALTGFGECFSTQNCNPQVRCIPIAGSDIRNFNPPTLSSSMINREGYYAFPPCSSPTCRTAGINTITVRCPCDPEGDPAFCAQNDPIIISLEDSLYRLTDRKGGVVFDLGDSGVPDQVPWTHPRSDEAFLVLDRNANGRIDNGLELFGDVTPQHPTDQPNGFLALALFDDVLSGGNEDGRISVADEIFPQLGLWRDRNHNGISESGELLTLAEAGLEWIDLDYESSRRVDGHGNAFRFRSQSGWLEDVTRTIWNVYLIAR